VTGACGRPGLVHVPAGRSYLNTAAEGLPIATAAAALARALAAKGRGSLGRDTLYAGEARCRAAAADLLGVETSEVALVPSVSDGIDQFVGAFPWRPGDEVLLNDLEFPSNVAPWLSARDRFGARVRVLPTRGGVLEPEDVESALTDQTRVVALSSVSFKSGGRVDLERIARLVHDAGAAVCLDATQGLGVVSVPKDAWDVVWSSGYKWLLGVHGVAVMAVRRATLDGLRGGAPGWRSVAEPFAADRFERLDWHTDARRFHAGMPAFGPIFVLEDAIAALQAVGIGVIEEHVEHLSQRLMTGLEALGVAPLTPRPPARRAGIVAFETPSFEGIAADLERAGVDVWARDGRVRVSFHCYTSLEDIDRCLEALGGSLPAHRPARTERSTPP
jgi:cysteine desulfurase / selenocysteine lyase